MKEKELRAAAECGICHKKIGASSLPMFWRVRIERHAIDLAALQRQQGLGLMIGGALAMVMGPDEELTKPLMEPVEITVCEPCCTKSIYIAELAPSPDNGDGK